jgi:hypothetical protein
MISDFRKSKYFWFQDWTADSALSRLANFDFSRQSVCEILDRGAMKSRWVRPCMTFVVRVSEFLLRESNVRGINGHNDTIARGNATLDSR